MRRRIAVASVTALVTAMLPLWAAGTAAAQTADGSAPAPQPGSATVVPIQVTGDPENRFTMVILGDGYTADEMDEFHEAIDRHLNTLWSIEPWRTYRSYINVYAVEIVSAESGVDCDPKLTSPRVQTPLDTGLWGGCNPNSVQRLLTVGDEAAAGRYARMATPHYDQILVLGNSDTYGGSGGGIATATGGNALSALITPHELGHSLGGLADEYDYYFRGVPGGPYTGGEPEAPNLTTLTKEQMKQQHRKWWRWLGEESTAGGTIGRYEGGLYSTTGIWRPSRHSMMKSLGYYYGQVNRQRMTWRISEQSKLIADATATKQPVEPDDVVWVETTDPVYYELDVTWKINGEIVQQAKGSRHLDLDKVDAQPGDMVTATVVDPTIFVRDPSIREAMTETRSWTIGDPSSGAQPMAEVAFTASTPTDRPVGSTDIVYVQTTHPENRALSVTWRLNGEPVANPVNSRSLDLAQLDLEVGVHRLTATVTDPAKPDAGSETLSWTVDNVAPSVRADLSDPLIHFELPGKPDHYVYNQQFTMELNASDNQPGYVVREFRLDEAAGGGWYNYYGWPTDSDAPFLFTPRGTNIKGLVYGNLGSGPMSLSPFVERVPGYGTHTVDYRAIDAAGNISEAEQFRVTVLRKPPACTRTLSDRHTGPLVVSTGVTCLDGASVIGPVRVQPGASLVATNASITGPVSATGAEVVRLVKTTVHGPVKISETTGDVTVLGADITGPVSLSDNHTGKGDAAIVAGTTITGPLRCSGNTPAPVNLGVPNTVTGPRTGQCAKL